MEFSRKNLTEVQIDRSKYYEGKIAIEDTGGDVLRSIIHERNIVRDYVKDDDIKENLRAKKEDLLLMKDRVDGFTLNTSEFESKVEDFSAKVYDFGQESAEFSSEIVEFDVKITRVNAEQGGFSEEEWNKLMAGWNGKIEYWKEKIQNWNNKVELWRDEGATCGNWVERWEEQFTEISQATSLRMRPLAILKRAGTHFKTFEEDLPKLESQVSSSESSLNSANLELEEIIEEFSHIERELTELQEH